MFAEVLETASSPGKSKLEAQEPRQELRGGGAHYPDTSWVTWQASAFLEPQFFLPLKSPMTYSALPQGKCEAEEAGARSGVLGPCSLLREATRPPSLCHTAALPVELPGQWTS